MIVNDPNYTRHIKEVHGLLLDGTKRSEDSTPARAPTRAKNKRKIYLQWLRLAKRAFFF